MTAKELREQRLALWEKMKEIHTRSLDETRDMTAEERESWNKADEEIVKLDERIADADKVEQRDRDFAVSPAAVPAGGSDPEERTDAEESEKRYTEAFNEYLRRGPGGMNEEQRTALQSGFVNDPELRAQSAGVTTEGGFTVPPEFLAKLFEAMKAYGGMRDVATVINTSTGADLPVPNDDDTASAGHILAENTQDIEGAITFGSKTIKSFTYTSKIVLVSFQLLNDSAFDLNSWLPTKLGIRLARGTNAGYTTGNGTTAPGGIVTDATQGGATGSSTTSWIYSEIVATEHSVDPAYRKNAKWMFNDDTLRITKLITDDESRPIFIPGNISNEAPNTILGYPYVINQDVAVMASTAKSVLFGDFSNFLIRDVVGVQTLRLAERYADYLQVGFLAFLRTGSGLVDAGTHPVRFFKNKT